VTDSKSETATASGDDEQVPARELTERRFAANLRFMRELAGLSQVSFARQMRGRDWPWRQQTVTRVESGQRLIRLGEAQAAAEILNTTIDRLTGPTDEMRDLELLAGWIRDARFAWRMISRGTSFLLNARRNLRLHPALASGEPPDSGLVGGAVREAREVQELTPEGALADGIAQIARNAESYSDRARVEGTVEIKLRDWDDRSAIAEALRQGEIVIVDFTETPTDEVLRLQDFISGAIEVRGGSASGVPDKRRILFRLTPATVSAFEERISELPETPDERRLWNG
jgi:FtsZ-interacting cell division protein YlmF